MIKILFPEKKREVYDLYGKEGVLNGGHKGDEDFGYDSAAFGGFHFHFRSPEEIFREFFGTDDPFAGFFGGRYTTQNYSMFHVKASVTSTVNDGVKNTSKLVRC